ncbi:hypothetical protein O7634_18730 [Micromonospora sp. WMMD1120]|uniref:hypothetical protein n=1 Tax=Micromonospora sp. WMMD1120 TaxID=3016106 RepID=UPI00241645FD|nr:hypothetical protein [Micromonospora sp. WMMD1120]MDG4808784.1 hypothetical protein [Micromonospora sp. WMMD1120]
MTSERVSSAGSVAMRVLGVVLVVVGVLGFVGSLTQGNVVGLVLGVLFAAGGAMLIKRSGGPATR